MRRKRFFKWSLPCSLLVLIAGILLNSLFATTPNTDSWHKIAPMPIGVFFASGSQVNHQYVVTGGVTGNGHTGSAIQVLNLDTLTWEIAGQLPTDRFAHAQCTLADGRILIASGRSGNLADMPSLTWLKDAWLWDSTTHQFTQLPDLSRKSRGPSAHTLPNGQTVVITEDTAHLLSADATQWEALIQLKATRIDHDAVAVTDHHLLIAAGAGRRSLELLDLNTRKSVLLGCQLPQPTDDLTISQLDNGQIWLTGGQDSLTGNTLSASWQLHLNVTHPADAYMTPGPQINAPLGIADHQVLQHGNLLFGLGGETQLDHHDTELALAWALNTEHRTVKLLPHLLEAHDDALAVHYQSQLLVIGGYQIKPAIFGLLTIPAATRTVERIVLKFPSKRN